MIYHWIEWNRVKCHGFAASYANHQISNVNVLLVCAWKCSMQMQTIKYCEYVDWCYFAFVQWNVLSMHAHERAENQSMKHFDGKLIQWICFLA